MTRSDNRSRTLGHASVWGPALVMAVLASSVAARTPLWRDEYASLSFAQLPLPELLRAVSHVDGVMLPYYLTASATQVLGGGAFALRLPSVLGMTVAAAATAALARRWWGPLAAVVAGLSLAVNPLAVQQGATARPYALATCFVALAGLALDRALRSPDPAGGPLRRALPWTAYAAGLAVAGLMHLFAILAVPAFFVLALSRRRVGRWSLATAIALVPVVPLMAFAFGQRGQVDWISRPTLRSGVGALASVLTFRGDSAFGPYEATALGLVGLAGAVLVALVVRRPRGERALEAGRAGFAVAAFGVPWLVLFAVSLVWTPFLRTTYLTPSLVGLGLLLGGAAALGLRAIPARRGATAWRVVLAAVVAAPLAASAAGAAPVVTRPWYVDDFPTLAGWVSQSVAPGDVLAVVQLYNEVGVAGGLARSLGDAGWAGELQRQLVAGQQPRLGLRRVDAVSPLRSEPVDRAPAGARVWVVHTRGAVTAEELGQSLAGLGCSGAAASERGAFGILRLAEVGCRA